MSYDDGRFRGAVYGVLQGSTKALADLLEILADEQRPLTHQDRLALSELIKHLTSRGKRGRRPANVFSRAWLVRQLAAEARRMHQSDPSRSLHLWAEEVVRQWRIAEFNRLRFEQKGEDLSRKIDELEERASKLTSSVETELRGRGVSKRRRRDC